MDTEKPDEQVFTNMSVRVGGAASQLNGFAHLYLEATNSDTFNSAEDIFLASNAVINGQDFNIPCTVSNITFNQYEPDRVYLVFQLTNDIDLAKTNTATFQVTNLGCQGPNGNIFNLLLWINF